MKLIGLTGGIASGKSTVAAMLARAGVPVLDADKLSRKVVEPGKPAYREIAGRWPEVLSPDGTIDRPKLGRIVFADNAQLRELRAMVVPRVVDELRREIAALEARGEPVCVVEAATLFEENLEHLFDGVLLVSAPPELQVRRLIERNGYSEEHARQRLAAQMSLEEKRRRSRWIVENAGRPEELEQRVREVWERILREA
ncbi:MAG: dephospho-CoA kinase [Myxococcales bacterium]|jgi:dephospho-CoA kinase